MWGLGFRENQRAVCFEEWVSGEEGRRVPILLSSVQVSPAVLRKVERLW